LERIYIASCRAATSDLTSFEPPVYLHESTLAISEAYMSGQRQNIV
jgi:hypothetical protein